MFSRRIGILTFGVALALTATEVRAADLSVPRPVVEEFSGWYLRGDIGFSNQRVGRLFNINYNNFDSVTNIDKSFDAAPIFGLGIGYYFNNWLRFDVTGEYRGKANFHGFDIGAIPGGGFSDDRYTGSKSEWTFLFNGYVDLGTWYRITPFIGAGVGVSRNTISNFGDFSVCVNSLSCAGNGGSDAFAGSASKWNFAWALYAGLGYQLSPDVALELSYRYIDLGSARTGDVIAFDGTNNFNNPMEFHHLTSQDIRLGLRVNFGALQGGPFLAPPPLLHSKG
ncbi:MAG TPA: outer membrane beta-barrel protein [Pseudolabrys sp.]|nr:outer membrane beta-barrel protein [Pseudolabrys sp.]